jgi:hypothetical protein
LALTFFPTMLNIFAIFVLRGVPLSYVPIVDMTGDVVYNI